MNVDKTAHLPTAVYRIYDAADRLIYVGQSQRMGLRMFTHRGYSWWYSLMDRIEVEYHPNRTAALAAEAIAIQEEAPAFNIAGSGREWGDFSHWTAKDEDTCREWLRFGVNWRRCPQIVQDYISGALAECRDRRAAA